MQPEQQQRQQQQQHRQKHQQMSISVAKPKNLFELDAIQIKVHGVHRTSENKDFGPLLSN